MPFEDFCEINKAKTLSEMLPARTGIQIGGQLDVEQV